MAEANAGSKPTSRSRAGCDRCRRRRQKCDEAQPRCGRCRLAGTDCSYNVNLRWGGRDFPRSRFGSCAVQKLEVPKGGFIYSSGAQSTSPTRSTAEQAVEGNVSLQTSSPQLPSAGFWPGPDLDPDSRGLLEYFIHVTSGTISSHNSLRSETCSLLLSIAAGAPSLLNSLLAMSAAHWSSSVGCTSTKWYWAIRANSFKLRSIRSLQQEMRSVAGSPLEVILATSLMLCQCVLAYNLGDYNAWRVFLTGAQAAMGHAKIASEGSTARRYLSRRFRLMEAIAMLSPRGFPASDSIKNFEDDDAGTSAVFLDDVLGCGTDVFQMLRDVSAAVWERNHLDNTPRGESILTLQDLLGEASSLERQLLQMIEQDPYTTLHLPAGIQETLTPEQVVEFRIYNRILQYTALIHLRAGVMRTPSTSQEIQSIVQEVLCLACSINPPQGLSPCLGLNTAVFIAGCHSLAADRPLVISLLSSLFESTRNNNMIHAQTVLSSHWSSLDDVCEVQTHMLSPNTCFGIAENVKSIDSPTTATLGALDFITY